MPQADLTEHVKDLKAQLRHAQKLACLGTTAAMLAHEYNNIYAPVVSYAQYALDKNDVELMRKTLSMILGHSEMVQAMSDRILGLVRQGNQSLQEVSLRHAVEDAVMCLGRNPTKDNIRVSVDIDQDIRVPAIQSQLQQVFFNLVINARQAMLGRSGHLKISATRISESQVTVHVRDNGKGIKEDHLPQILTPFFTTKQDEDRQDKRGIGLGLAICKDIIEEHGGTIAIESIEGHGTTVTITLPTTTAQA